MQISSKFEIAVFTFALSIGVAKAQQAASQTLPDKNTIHLSVVLSGAHSAVASGLTQQDFTLLDNGVPTPITAFREIKETTKSPVSVLIVVDAVNTPFTALSYQRDQIEKYLRMNEGRLEHSTTFAVLTDKDVQIDNKISTDGMALADDLQHYDIGLRTIGRAQGFYGASDRMTISLNALREIAAFEAKSPGRKIVVWVSPGWPLLSGPEIELDGKQQNQIYRDIVLFSTQMRDSGITLYNVNSWGVGESVGRALYYENFVKGVSKPEQTQFGNIGLQVLAEQSGGLVLNSSGVVEALQKAVADADDSYDVSFQAAPSEKPGEYHRLEVRVDKPGVKARTRQGYYSAQ